MNARTRILIVLSSWPVLVALALWARARGPFDASASARGQNWPGDLAHVALFGAVEVAVLLLLVRPWSYRHSWGRAVSAAVLFGAYGLFSLFAAMHAGSVLGVHGLWLLAVAAGMLVAALLSLLAPRTEAAA